MKCEIHINTIPAERIECITVADDIVWAGSREGSLYAFDAKVIIKYTVFY